MKPINEGYILQQRPVLGGLATVSRLRDGTTRFRFAYGKLALIFTLTITVAWVCFFSAAYLHFKYRRGYAEVSYVETLLFPLTHESFQKKRGIYYIESAYRAIEQGDLREALHLMRNGLLRAPDHLPARKTLSEFYEFAFNRPVLAFDLAADGIDFLSLQSEADRETYLQHLFAIGSRNQLDHALIDAGLRIHAATGATLSRAMRALVSYQIATGYRNIGDTQSAETWLQRDDLLQFTEGRVLQAQLLWDQGEEQASITLLETQLDRFRDNALLYEKLITLLEEQHQYQRARRYVLLYVIEHPGHFRAQLARLQHFYRFASATDSDKIQRFVEEYVDAFSSDATALQQLAILTSKFGDVVHTRRVLDLQAQSVSQPSPQLEAFILVEAKIRSGAYREALADLLAIEASISEQHPMHPDSTSIFLSLKTAAHHGMGDAILTRQSLDELLSSSAIQLDRYLAVAYLFLEVNAPEIARLIVEHCLQSHASNANIREALIAIYLQQEDVPALSNQLMQAIDQRKLPNRLLEDAYRLLSSDRYLHVENRSSVMEKIQECFANDYLFKRN